MQEHRTRDDTRRLILKAVADSAQPLTRTQIARAIERKKSPHLIDLIEELVQEGRLYCEIKTFHNGVKGYVYAAPAD